MFMLIFLYCYVNLALSLSTYIHACRLFRLILKTGTYPSSWKHTLVQPVPKKGDRSNPSNYRPIALSSAIAKVFESILNSHFLNHLEKNLLLSDHQYGFRKARSTGDLLSYLTHLWSSSLRDFGESFVVALDISKAFDRVWHKALLAKLSAYGFTPSLCNLISSYLCLGSRKENVPFTSHIHRRFQQVRHGIVNL